VVCPTRRSRWRRRPESTTHLARTGATTARGSGEPWPAHDDSYELTDEDRNWARRTVASLPPLTDRQRDILALLLRGHR
jgi:hypothetical protein